MRVGVAGTRSWRPALVASGGSLHAFHHPARSDLRYQRRRALVGAGHRRSHRLHAHRRRRRRRALGRGDSYRPRLSRLTPRARVGTFGGGRTQRTARPGHHVVAARRSGAARSADAVGRRRVSHRGRRPGHEFRARWHVLRRFRCGPRDGWVCAVGVGIRLARVRQRGARNVQPHSRCTARRRSHLG